MTDFHSEREATATSDPYTVRSYEPGDREDLRRLFEDVWGSNRSEAWVAYKHETNPYLDGSPMVVAEIGGDVVGARPHVPFPMRAGSTDLRAVYLNNAMVHPDHRRQGLFTRMTERTVTAFADSPVSVLLAFANDLSAPGYREQDFLNVGTDAGQPFRVRDPGRIVRNRVDLPGGRLAGVAATAAMRGYLSLRRLGRRSSTWWVVERRPGITDSTLAELYETDPPTSLHARREARLYRWLDDDPYWQYGTYFASRNGSLEAATVVRQSADTNPDRVEIVDAVPTASQSVESAYAALLDAVLADYPDASLVSATGPVLNERLFPRGLLSQFGFLSSTHPLVSRFAATGDTAFVHPLAASGVDNATVGGVDVADPTNWQVTFR